MRPDQIFQAVSPSVAKLTVKDEDGKEFAYASGFVVDPQWVYSREPQRKRWDDSYARKIGTVAYLLTNYHAIEVAADVEARLGDRRWGHVTEVLDEDETSDLALLVVVVGGTSSWAEFSEVGSDAPVGVQQAPSSEPLTPARPGASADGATVNELMARILGPAGAPPQQQPGPVPALRLLEATPLPVGATVYAIGSPRGLANTLSEGVVSGQRDIKGHPWLQTTAPISPGSSGGPLLNQEGEVVGVTTFLYEQGQNLNFAVPAPVVVEFLTGPLRERRIGQGVSISDEEEQAFILAKLSRWAMPSSGGGALTDVGYSDQVNFLLQAHAQLEAKQYDAAVSSAQAALRAKSGPHEYLAHYLLGCALFWSELGRDQQDWRLPIPSFEDAARLKPSFAPALDMLATIYLMDGDHAKSLLVADRLVTLVPRSYKAYEYRGQAYEGLRQYRSAVEDYRKALALRPNHPSLYDRLGLAYVRMGEFGASIEALQSAVRCAGDDSPMRWAYEANLGGAYMGAQRYDDALAAFESALRDGCPASMQDGVRHNIQLCRTGYRR